VPRQRAPVTSTSRFATVKESAWRAVRVDDVGLGACRVDCETGLLPLAYAAATGDFACLDRRQLRDTHAVRISDHE
jgi:hypothetical protein